LFRLSLVNHLVAIAFYFFLLTIVNTMKYAAVFVLAAFAAVASAQIVDDRTPTPAPPPPTVPEIPSNSDVKCANFNVFSRCQEDNKRHISNCKTNEYACLCEHYKALALCYDQCADDPIVFGQKGSIESAAQSYCRAAPSTSTTSTSTPTQTVDDEDTEDDADDSSASHAHAVTGLLTGALTLTGLYAYLA
jgi:hypothetical protein